MRSFWNLGKLWSFGLHRGSSACSSSYSPKYSTFSSVRLLDSIHFHKSKSTKQIYFSWFFSWEASYLIAKTKSLKQFGRFSMAYLSICSYFCPFCSLKNFSNIPIYCSYWPKDGLEKPYGAWFFKVLFTCPMKSFKSFDNASGYALKDSWQPLWEFLACFLGTMYL